MRAKASLLALTILANPLLIKAQGVDQMAKKLMDMPEYLSDASFEVLLPSAFDPITYNLTLESELPADSLSPCQYVIRWQGMSPAGPVDGFSAYFDGHHYRYRANRLQEYHAAEQPLAFAPQGRGPQAGVQQQAQFADLLPQFLGQRLLDMAADSAYFFTVHPDTIINGRKAFAIEGTKTTRGYEAQEYLYAFDANTAQPLLIDVTTSPGSISEQTYTATFSSPSQDAIEISEEGLIEAWPEVFEKYRQSMFRAENLPGTPMPSFSCKLLGEGDRWEYNRGETLNVPTLFVVIDPAVSSARQTIAAVREAAAQLPFLVEIAWVFNSNREDEIAPLLGEIQPEEKGLTSASAIIRNCGISVYPTIILTQKNGIIKEVIPGFNNDLVSIVIQKASLIRD